MAPNTEFRRSDGNFHQKTAAVHGFYDFLLKYTLNGIINKDVDFFTQILYTVLGRYQADIRRYNQGSA